MTLTQLSDFASQHFVEIAAGYIATNLMATSMPPAGPDSSTGYKWLYAFVHSLALNVRNVVAIWNPKVANVPGFQRAQESEAKEGQ